MAELIAAADALRAHRLNRRRAWNRAESSKERSPFPLDAANRIYDEYASVAPGYDGPKMGRDARVFAMGSCFAREMESVLMARGGNVISVDETIRRPEFRDRKGVERTAFFHRFTPLSMAQEVASAFGELPGWDEDSLIFRRWRSFADVNYWAVPGADDSREAVRVRRAVAQALVRRAARADLVILTLGLIEAWVHRESGFTANHAGATFLARQRDAFAFRRIGQAETVRCLETIRDTLRRHHEGTFRMIVTVSPVPLIATFTDQDVIVANMDSKATLRAAAMEFVARHDDVHYFPSYEMVMASNPKRAWQNDRLHVRAGMVAHVIDGFIDSLYEPGAFGGA